MIGPARRAGLALALATVLALPAGALAGRRLPDVVEDAQAFATTDRAKAIQLLEEAWDAAQGAPEASVLALYAGEQRRLAGDGDAAHLWFVKATDGDAAEAAKLGLAVNDTRGEPSAEAAAVLEEASEKGAPDTLNADRYLLLARRAARQNDGDRAAAYSRKALAFAKEDPEVLARVTRSLEELSTPAAAATPTDKLAKAEAALADGRPDDARRLAESVRDSAAAGSTEADQAAWLLKRLDGAPVNPSRIVVLLPLSGKFGAAGGQVREAVTWGWTHGGGSAADLVFADSGAQSATAAAALEKAVLEDGAIAVMGPLLSEEAEAVAATADRLHVPLVSLSQGLDDVGRFQWVFQSAVTPRQQITALLDYLTTARGMKSFGVFAPDDDYGKRAADVFTEVAKSRGASVAASASYDADATVVSGPAHELAAQDDPKDNLSYDALFVPENARRVPLACAGLAMEEFPMGTFAPHPNIKTIPLLGLNGWNNPSLVTTGNEYTRNSVFTDVFLPSAGSALPEMQSFTAAYKSDLGRTPTSLEAAAADAGRIVAQAAAAHPTTRDAFRAALTGLKPTDTVTGIVGFDPKDHTLDREVLVLTITRGGISVLDTIAPE